MLACIQGFLFILLSGDKIAYQERKCLDPINGKDIPYLGSPAHIVGTQLHGNYIWYS